MENKKIYKRNAVYSDLKDYDYLVQKDSFIEITQWTNGKGIDIYISGHTDKYISLSYGELKAVKKLTKILEDE